MWCILLFNDDLMVSDTPACAHTNARLSFQKRERENFAPKYDRVAYNCSTSTYFSLFHYSSCDTGNFRFDHLVGMFLYSCLLCKRSKALCKAANRPLVIPVLNWRSNELLLTIFSRSFHLLLICNGILSTSDIFDLMMMMAAVCWCEN